MQHLKATFALLAAFAVTGGAALAKPNVQLKLAGELLQKDAQGAVSFVPMSTTELKPGQIVRFDIVAKNEGSDAATALVPVGKIPTGTAYEAGSASASGALRVEFSLDGGKTWSSSPTVKVVTPNGTVVKKADPASYTQVRWIAAKPLAPKSSVTYRYEVRVK